MEMVRILGADQAGQLGQIEMCGSKFLCAALREGRLQPGDFAIGIKNLRPDISFKAAVCPCEAESLKEPRENTDRARAMSTTATDSNSPLEQLGRLGHLLSDLEFNSETGKQDTSELSVGNLKKLLASIESSISDLESQIVSNKKEQKALAAASRKLKKEIRELSEKLASEVSKLAKATKAL